MKPSKLINRIGTLTVLFLAFACNSSSQENKLFEEYLNLTFVNANPTEHLTLYSDLLDSTKRFESLSYGVYRFQDFIPVEMGSISADTLIIPYLKFNKGDYIITLFKYITTDDSVFENNASSYYFVIYNRSGEIVGVNKLLAERDQQWFENGVNYDSKLFISKEKIRYLLYGPYKSNATETSCLEIVYKISNDGKLEKLIERQFSTSKADGLNWQP